MVRCDTDAVECERRDAMDCQHTTTHYLSRDVKHTHSLARTLRRGRGSSSGSPLGGLALSLACRLVRGPMRTLTRWNDTRRHSLSHTHTHTHTHSLTCAAVARLVTRRALRERSLRLAALDTLHDRRLAGGGLPLHSRRHHAVALTLALARLCVLAARRCSGGLGAQHSTLQLVIGPVLVLTLCTHTNETPSTTITHNTHARTGVAVLSSVAPRARQEGITPTLAARFTLRQDVA